MAASQRQLRVGELVRHALSDILMRGGTYDPELDGRPITVPEVRMSPDLKIATVFVMPLGGGDGERVVKALARSARFLRGELAKRVRQLKYQPELRFRLDTRFDDDDRMRAVLAEPEVAADVSTDEGSAATGDGADGAGPDAVAADVAGRGDPHAEALAADVTGEPDEAIAADVDPRDADEEGKGG